MANKPNIKCLFGFHEYTTPWEKDKDVLICKHCRRFAHRKWYWGSETWYEFDNEGRLIYYNTSNGAEAWFDGKKWVYEKPKNWKYEEWLIK